MFLSEVVGPSSLCHALLAKRDTCSADYDLSIIDSMTTDRQTPSEGGPAARSHGPDWVYRLDASDPHGELLDRSGMSEEELGQIDELMAALGRLRSAERELSEASLQYMKLNETDMKALHFLIACEHRGIVATPGAIATHLRISSASTTKLLDRLEKAGHLRRGTHPSDRRALAISIESATRTAAMRTVGAQQARRFHAARRLSTVERESVIGFLDDMAHEISVDGLDWGDPAPPDEGP